MLGLVSDMTNNFMRTGKRVHFSYILLAETLELFCLKHLGEGK